MRSSVSASERARLRGRQRLIDAGVLNSNLLDEDELEGLPGGGGDYNGIGGKSGRRSSRRESGDRESSDDELMNEEKWRKRRGKRRAIVNNNDNDDDDDDDDDDENEKDLKKNKNKKKKKKKLHEDDDDDDEEMDDEFFDKDKIKKYQKSIEKAEEEYDSEQVLLRMQKEDKSDVPLMPFNLKEEKETGEFDAIGNYKWRRRRGQDDSDEEKDPWLASLNGKDDIAKIRKVDSDTRKRSRTSIETDENPKKSNEANIQMLVQYLEPGETVLKALKRYGKGGKDQKDEKDSSKRKLSDITDAAMDLMTDAPDIYEKTREELDGMISAKRKKIMDETFWEYRLSMDPEAEIHGPYSATNIQAWKEQGYFGGDNSAFVRKVSKGNSETATGGNSTSPCAKKMKVTKSLADELDADFDDEDDDNDDENVTEKSQESDSSTVDFQDVFT